MSYKELLKDKYICNNNTIEEKLNILNRKRKEGKLLRYSTDKDSWISLYNKDTNEYFIFNNIKHNNFNNKVMDTLKDINKELIEKYGDEYVKYSPKIRNAYIN
jgi:hypothetical protein